jgi:hypothetical protein
MNRPKRSCDRPALAKSATEKILTFDLSSALRIGEEGSQAL